MFHFEGMSNSNTGIPHFLIMVNKIKHVCTLNLPAPTIHTIRERENLKRCRGYFWFCQQQSGLFQSIMDKIKGYCWTIRLMGVQSMVRSVILSLQGNQSVFLISETIRYIHYYYFILDVYLSHDSCFYYMQCYFRFCVLFGKS